MDEAAAPNTRSRRRRTASSEGPAVEVVIDAAGPSTSSNKASTRSKRDRKPSSSKFQLHPQLPHLPQQRILIPCAFDSIHRSRPGQSTTTARRATQEDAHSSKHSQGFRQQGVQRRCKPRRPSELQLETHELRCVCFRQGSTHRCRRLCS